VLLNAATDIAIFRITEGLVDQRSSFPVPDDITAERMQWLSDDALAVLSSDRALLLTLPDRAQTHILPGRPVDAWANPGASSAVVLLEDGALYELRSDGSDPEHLLASVEAVGLAPNNTLLAVQQRAVVRLDGTSLGVPLPVGVHARGIAQNASDLHVWDAQMQHWRLSEGDAWELEPGLVEDVLVGARFGFIGSGSVTDGAGAQLLRIDGAIRSARAWSDDVLLLHRGTTVLHCSLALRRCESLAGDVSDYWLTRGGLLLLQDQMLGFLPLEEN